jgi:hypothetical protein
VEGCAQNFTQLSGRDNFYVLPLGVVYLAWCDFAMDSTKEQHQILCKSRKNATENLAMTRQALGKKALAVRGCLNRMFGSGQTEKARQVKIKVKSMLIIFFDIKGIVHKKFFLAGQTVNSA